MAKTSKYFMQSGNNLLDFSLNFDALNQAGQRILVKGTGGSDSIFLGGGGYNFTYQQSDGGDRIYINALSTDFSAIAPNSTTLNLTRTVNSVTTNINLPSGVNVIFNDGFISSTTWITAPKSNDGTTPIPTINSSLKSGITVDLFAQDNLTAGQSYSSKVKGFASGDGATFSSIQSGMKLTPKGTSGVDYVYVRQGTEVDCTQLGDSSDRIYLTGNFQDYTRAFDTKGNFVLIRTLAGGASEIITIKDSNDVMIYANGSITLAHLIQYGISNWGLGNALNVVANANGIYSWNSSVTTPGLIANTASISNIVDDVAPNGSTTLNPSNGTITASGGVTNDTQPQLNGTLLSALGAGLFVKVFDKNEFLGTATVSNTSWSYQDTRTLADAYVAQYRAAVGDASDHLSALSGIFSVTIDTRAPSVGITSLVDFVDSGTSTSDKISTDNVFSLSTSGNEAGSTTSFQISTDNANGTGTWTDTTAAQGSQAQGLADGSYWYRTKVVDAAGNTNFTPAVKVVVDTTAPTITGGASATATSLDEKTGTSQAVYTASVTDSNSFSYVLGGTDVSAFSLNTATGVVTLNGNPNYAGKSLYSFSIIATDIAGNSSSQSVTLPINDKTAPTFANSSVTASSVNENSAITTVVFTASATDASSVSYSLGAANLNDNALFNISAGKVRLNASADYETKSIYRFDVIATDSNGNSSSQSVTLPIGNVNEHTVLASGVSGNGANAFIRGVASTFSVASDFVDPEGATLSYSLVGTLPAGLSFNSSTGRITSTTSTAIASATNVTITASDGVTNPDGADASRVYALSIISGPQVTSIDVSDSSGNTKAGKSGDTVTVVLTLSEVVNVTPAGSAINGLSFVPTLKTNGTDLTNITFVSSATVNNKTTITYTAVLPNENYASVDLTGLAINSVTLTGATSNAVMSNGLDNTISGTYRIDSTAPVFTSGSGTSVNENISTTTAVYTAVATDASASLSYSLSGTDAGSFDINSSNGKVTFKASPDYEGGTTAYSFSVIATDVAGNTASKAVNVNINNVDEAGTVSLTATGWIAGETLTASAVTDPDGGVAGTTYQWQLDGVDISGATGSTYVIRSSDVGSQFKVVASYTDNQGGVANTHTATSTPSNHVVGLSFANFTDTGPSNTDGVTSDNSFDLSSGFSPIGVSTIFQQSLNNGGWNSLANANLSNLAEGNYQFRAIVNENGSATTSAGISVVVDRTAPSFDSTIPTAIDENIGASAVIYTAHANDTNTISYSLGGTNASSFSVNASTGVVSINASPNYEVKSTYSFNVIATDLAGNTNSQSVGLTINNLDEAGTIAITGAQTSGATLSASVSDPDGIIGAITYQWKTVVSYYHDPDSAGNIVTLDVAVDHWTHDAITDAIWNPYALNATYVANGILIITYVCLAVAIIMDM